MVEVGYSAQQLVSGGFQRIFGRFMAYAPIHNKCGRQCSAVDGLLLRTRCTACLFMVDCVQRSYSSQSIAYFLCQLDVVPNR